MYILVTKHIQNAFHSEDIMLTLDNDSSNYVYFGNGSYRVPFMKNHTNLRVCSLFVCFLCLWIANRNMPITFGGTFGKIVLNYILFSKDGILLIWYAYQEGKNLFAWNWSSEMRAVQWRYYNLSYSWMQKYAECCPTCFCLQSISQGAIERCRQKHDNLCSHTDGKICSIHSKRKEKTNCSSSTCTVCHP